jgi:flotillin
MSLIITLLVVAVVFGIVLSMVLTRFLYICQPNEVLVFSGGQRASVGRKVGYRIIKGGRALRIPLLETVDSMDLTNMPIEVAVQGAYSKGGIPVNVHGIANVKVAGEQPVLDNAIERFLGVDRGRHHGDREGHAGGNLRGVLATLTPEELNEDKIKFAQSLLAEAEDDLRRLGLELDTLKIQDVSDDVGLPGQHRAPAVRRGSEEGADRRGARQGRGGRAVGQQPARDRDVEDRGADIDRARRERAAAGGRADAQRGAGRRVPGAGGVAAGPRRGRAGGPEGAHRAGQAQAGRRHSGAGARGQGRPPRRTPRAPPPRSIEQGRATAAAMGQIAATWREVGPSARSVFLMQKVADLSRIVMGTVGSLKVDKLTVLGGVGGGGSGLGDLTGRLIAASEQIKAATGIDIGAALRSRTPPATPKQR